MPRLRPSLFWLARKRISPLAAPMLRVCRDLPSTANEFRWIKEHIATFPSLIPPKIRLFQLCEKRAQGIPLQYVLGTQPFGDLEILCKPGVLIPRYFAPFLSHHSYSQNPRPETEAYTLEIASLILSESPKPSSLTIIDFCTGTGCITLQLFTSLQSSTPSLTIHGIDISPKAITLARRNLRYNLSHKFILSTPTPTQQITFHQADIFSPSLLSSLGLAKTTKLDLLISNPPYISPRSFARDTARSVRNYEPKLALVPNRAKEEIEELNSDEADVFYARLLSLSKTLEPKRVVFEVAGSEQAKRVIQMVYRDPWLREQYIKVEMWRDYPRGGAEKADIDGRTVTVRGVGNVRVVYLESKDLRGLKS